MDIRISTRTLLVEHDSNVMGQQIMLGISLLTRPLRDVTDSLIVSLTCLTTFLLTRPLRDVTNPGKIDCMLLTISTHTPLAGRDYDPVLLSTL